MSSATPLVSVALCTYNGAPYLREQLDSLLAQDYAPLEIVAVDDGSGDDTVAIMEEYARRDSRLKVRRNPANLGFRRNFEKVIGLCQGELIATCDQDDVWHPAKLRILQHAMQDALLVYCDSELITAAGKRTGERVSGLVNMVDGSDPRWFAFHNCISGHAMLFRRELTDSALPFPATGYHDQWLAFVAASIGRIRYVDRPLVQYRRHEQAHSAMAGSRASPRSAAARDSELAAWLAALANYERCPQQPLFRRLEAAWAARSERYFTPELFSLVFANRGGFFRISGNEPGRMLRSLRYLWGGRLKRLLNPGRYSGR
jgi:glycosyltransferase involved in cell wall biosynthesis